MPTVYLAVGETYSSIHYQGALDSLPGFGQGDPIACPGAFTCRISLKLRVLSNTSSLVASKVYAGASHLVLQEEIHNFIPSFGSRIRVESKGRRTRVLGGLFTENLTNTITPRLQPYFNSDNLPSISLAGLPTRLFTSLPGFPVANTSTPDTSNPAASGNVHTYIDQLDLTFSDHFLANGINLLWSAGSSGNLPISINLAGAVDELDSLRIYFLANSLVKTPYTPVKFHIYPVLQSPFTQIVDFDAVSTYTDFFNYPAFYFAPMANAPVFPCFSGSVNGGVGQSSTVLGTQTSNYVRSLTVYPVSDTTNFEGLYSFAGVKELDDTAFIGMFSKSDPFNPTPTAEFFKNYSRDSNPFSSGTKPSLYFNSALQSRGTNTLSQSFTNSYWSAAYPSGARYSKYLDVKSTQYGFVFLNKDTRHLEFMFQPHLEPWFASADVQVVNKVMHAPPRSADYIPALNMLLGVSPLTPTAGSSLYSNAAAIPNGGGSYYDADSHLHGGGGHVAAMGTFNGAVVNDGKITVWGSNRWGQCVLPDAVKNVRIVDVAVSVSPPVLLDPGADAFSYPPYEHSVYSDQAAERAARDYAATANDPFAVNTTGADPYMYSYPPMWTAVDGTSNIRHAKHINYTNLPGHVVVVTDAGWVYAWGNNLYRQCQVPSEISLVDNTGAVKTGAPATPISEVAAGAFHTVARARNGALYVWGAGGVASGGAIGFPSGAGETTPIGTLTYPGGTLYGSVQFGQSFLGNATSTANTSHGLATPANIPPGTSAQAVQTYATFNVYPSANITTVLDPAGVTVGQKTAAGFCPSDPADGRLKGMIAAGAFHTAVIDSQLKIQCFGAGRGPCTGSTSSVVDPFDLTFFTQDGFSIPHWGNSFSRDNFYTFDTYPHYCQSMSQYRAPLASISTTNGGPYLFRFANSQAPAEKLKFFQDLRFKKVVCGPFTTHGIVYDVDRVATTQQFSAADKAFMHGRVVSWGQVYSPRGKYASATGSTGVLHYSRVNAGTLSLATASSQGWASSGTIADLAGTIAGMGSADYLSGLTGSPASAVPRMFRLLNKQLASSTPTTDPATLLPVSTATENQYRTRCPVTISTFKVKDMASCGDFAMYIGYINTLQQDSVRHHPSDVNAPNSGATFDYQASVFFTGSDYYHNGAITNSTAPSSVPGRMHTNNPYAGGSWVRRNKVGHLDGIYEWNGNTGLKIKDRSPYFGLVRQEAVSGLTLATGDTSTTRAVNYVIPTSAFASCNFVAMAVNMDNRPVAWTGFFQLGPKYLASLDLSLLPSVPLSSFKTGRAHIMAVTAGDWPIAISLASSAGVPKVCSELGTRLFTTAPSVTTAPTLLWGDSSPGQNDGLSRVRRPVLLSWGAGDGREYGTSLLSFNAGSGSESTYGMWFLDTHAMSRYDQTYTTPPTQPLAVSGSDPWENFYGHYRWNVYSKYDSAYIEPPILSSGTGGTTLNSMGERPQPTGESINLPKGHAAVEAMQSILNFRYDAYPSDFTTPALTGRNHLNGTMMAAVPSAALRPWIVSSNFSTLPVRNRVCCSTSADATESTRTAINLMQEYHSPLGLYVQNYNDYVVDYAAGDMHSAVLFASTVPNFSTVQSKAHLANLSAFTSSFMSVEGGTVPFGNRRICKLALQGYGCEGQTGGTERYLADGALAPIVPMMFSRDAKIYAGDSYTLVTNPIRVVVASSAPTSVVLTSTGSGFSTMSVPISIPSSQFSRRIRGLDIVLTFTATAAPASIPLSSWTVNIPYKQSTWTVLGRVKAGTSNAFVPAGSAVTSYRVSDRFNPSRAYIHLGVDNYDESGLSPAVTSSYSPTSPFTLLGIDQAAAVPSLSKQGNYYPVSVDPTTSAVTDQFWSVQSAAGVSYPFDESTINVVIEDATSATSYAGYTVTATIEAEVDATQVPYVIFGPTRSGVFNEVPGQGPSYVADLDGFISGQDARFTCPCEIQPPGPTATTTREYPKAFPADSRFLCGTKKYGPLGNRENLAAYVNQPYSDPLTFNFRDALLKAPRITANFFNLFDTIPHRTFIKMSEDVRDLPPTLEVLPPGAFISLQNDVFCSGSGAPSLTVSAAAASIQIRLSAITAVNAKLQVPAAVLYNAVLRPISVGLNLTIPAARLNLRLALQSGVDCVPPQSPLPD